MPRAVVSCGLPLPAWPLEEKKGEEPVPLSTWGSGADGALREEDTAATTADDDRGGGLATDDALADRPPQRVAEVPRQLLAARRPAAAAVAAVDSQNRGGGPIVARARQTERGGGGGRGWECGRRGARDRGAVATDRVISQVQLIALSARAKYLHPAEGCHASVEFCMRLT